MVKTREAIRAVQPRGGCPQRHNISHFNLQSYLFFFCFFVSLHFNRWSFFNNSFLNFLHFEVTFIVTLRATRRRRRATYLYAFQLNDDLPRSFRLPMFTIECFIWIYFIATDVMMNVYVTLSYFNGSNEFVNSRSETFRPIKMKLIIV